MEINRLIDEIGKTKYWKCEAPAVFQIVQPPMLGFGRMPEYFPGLEYVPVIFVIKNGYCHQFTDEENNLLWTKYIIGNCKKDKRYLRKLFGKWEKLRKRADGLMNKIGKSDLNELDSKNLYGLFEGYFEVIADAWAIPLILEGSGIYFEKVLAPKTGLKMEDLTFLVQSEKPSFALEEHKSLLELALVAKGPNDCAVKKHRDNFFWTRNNYKDVVDLSVDDFWAEIEQIRENKTPEEIREELRKKNDINKEKQILLKKLSLKEELEEELALFSFFSYWMDERKKLNIRESHYLAILLNEISKRMEIPFEDLMQAYNFEIRSFLTENKPVDTGVLERRGTGITVFCKNPLEIVEEKNSKLLERELFGMLKSGGGSQLRGMVVYRGRVEKVCGKVNLILDIRKDKFEDGSILVTSMTRPEFVPLVKRAKAVITDEGGVTCHAAIISRELNIPCIVGTKNATKVLKDGDLVEVDANKGVVKILKKA
ncbi:MAG: hypothetical protein A2365_02415 [Candidatus Nealsonbacteria bacterium RIFOXYB1_FULL_40_15]|uniref:PEP-utilising enzyme mobile domain-containing protein n=2 Tax=Candidatus Nealsoniibacteriota TaxID=1817911 RepID=A0A1G2EPC3_9BACT|nr:MAG: hypothetical protein A2365_02415 [Candidatus Nealsonbacteria bacterium RIFOXYB1_FULL_40_15]OGZ27643.1 MAG: hypothetical protein A2427_02740 [Candidatus Nealsonbacteria bacterium RIFOXYC1_FULL_40_7]OGZ28687.1 MAG: hypothetical protein A2562_00545 [Candidatus Nealsonbacteria bacterium RIFOXYD1_FULL_39_11]